MIKNVITGFGIFTPKSNKPDILWRHLLNKEDLFDVVEIDDKMQIKQGKAPIFKVEEYGIQKKILRYIDKQVLYSVGAAIENVKASKLEEQLKIENVSKRTGIVMGSMFAQMDFGLEQIGVTGVENSTRISPYTGVAFYYGASVGEVSVKLKTKGENCAVLSGTNTGIDALNIACNMLDKKTNDIVLAGGGENVVLELFLNGLNLTKKISKTSYRPFDTRRDGSFISNGAGVVTVETDKNAKKRGCEIYGEIASIHTINASSCLFELNEQIVDYTYEVINRCLEDVGIKPEEIDLVVPTADGTKDGDYYEMMALKKVFGGRNKIIYTPKPIVGYCMSFNSIIDIFVGAMSIKHSLIPGHPEKYDSGDEEFNEMLVGTEPVKRDVKNVLLLHRSWIDGKVSALLLRKYIA